MMRYLTFEPSAGSYGSLLRQPLGGYRVVGAMAHHARADPEHDMKQRCYIQSYNRSRCDGAPFFVAWACRRNGAARCDSVQAVLRNRNTQTLRACTQPPLPPSAHGPTAVAGTLSPTRTLHNTPAPRAKARTLPRLPRPANCRPSRQEAPTKVFNQPDTTAATERPRRRCQPKGCGAGQPVTALADTARASLGPGGKPSASARHAQTPLTCSTRLLPARSCAIGHPATPAGPRQASALRRQSIHMPRRCAQEAEPAAPAPCLKPCERPPCARAGPGHRA